MKIGLFSATYLDQKLEDVCRMAASLGYEAVELPAFSDNPHLDVEAVHAVQAREEPRPEAVAAYARLMPVYERMRAAEAEICQMLLETGL